MAVELQPANKLLHRRLAGACIALIVLLVSVQAVHVHKSTGTADTTCLICVSAHTSAPVAAVVTQVVLMTIASLPVLRALTVPTCSAVLPLFIRPPPTV